VIMVSPIKHNSDQTCWLKRTYVILLSIILVLGIPIVMLAGDREPTVLPESKTINREPGRNHLVAPGSRPENKGKVPATRFTDKGDGTVRDNLSGLIWLKNANCFGLITWVDARAVSGKLAGGGCGLTDGSAAGDWRLPSVKELQSLIDFGNYDPALPKGHPFTDVQSSAYWSSTEYANDSSYAWHVYTYFGGVTTNIKSGNYYVWPVRGYARCGSREK